MEHFKWNFKTGNKPLEIIGLTDIHFGSPNCNVEFLKQIIKKIKSKPRCRVVLLGDLIDCGLKNSPGASIYEQTMNPKHQIEEIVKILKPIQKQILSSNIGNHTLRLSSAVGLDGMQIICDNLSINNGKFQTINTIKVGKETYQIFSTHGNTNAMTNEGRVNVFKKYLDNIDCDVMLAGHCHALQQRQWEKRIVTSKGIEEKTTTLVLCGNFLSYENSYAEFKGYALLKPGCAMIKLYPNKHKVDVDLHWWEKD